MFLLSTFLNQLIKVKVSLYWFTFKKRFSSFIIQSKNVLLITPIPLFEGFNSLQFVFDLKFPFWSSNVSKPLRSA